MERYDVSSVGRLYRISLEMFADRLVDENGNDIKAAEMKIHDRAYAIFRSGTGNTRTSLVRIE